MKVLLLGEFSGLHQNLAVGLSNSGHEVVRAGFGDGFKKIKTDINLDSSKATVMAAVERRLNLMSNLSYFKGFDIVQLINPFCLFYYPVLSKALIRYLKRNNKKVFVLAAGTDSYYLKYAPKLMDYSPIPELLQYDLKKDKHPLEGVMQFNFNRWLANSVNAVIPVMYDYEICYRTVDNLANVIPLPF